MLKENCYRQTSNCNSAYNYTYVRRRVIYLLFFSSLFLCSRTKVTEIAPQRFQEDCYINALWFYKTITTSYLKVLYKCKHFWFTVMWKVPYISSYGTVHSRDGEENILSYWLYILKYIALTGRNELQSNYWYFIATFCHFELYISLETRGSSQLNKSMKRPVQNNSLVCSLFYSAKGAMGNKRDFHM